jgi:hypothetical protein
VAAEIEKRQGLLDALSSAKENKATALNGLYIKLSNFDIVTEHNRLA